jgi:thiamine transporter
MRKHKIDLLNKFDDFVRKNYWILGVFAGILAILMLFLPVVKYEIREAVYRLADDEAVIKNDYVYSMNLISYITTSFKLNWTIFVSIGFVVIGIVLLSLKKIKEDLSALSGIMFLLAACMFLLSVEFFRSDLNEVMEHAKIVGGLKWDPTTEYNYNYLHEATISWGAVLAITFCVLAFAFTTTSNNNRTIKDIAEEGVLIAMAFVLNLIKIPIGATGGSLNFQMLPLMVIALRHGAQRGLLAGGIIYGLLTCLTDGYGFATYPFDYLIGFGSVAILGLLRNQIFSEKQEGYNLKGLLFILLGGTLMTLVRFIGSTVSSIVVYGYSLEAALAYNALYIPLSGLVSTVALMLLYAPLIRINNYYSAKSI